jgi:light-regulated signal transduction histidine kinase (bacteriophytochrome)
MLTKRVPDLNTMPEDEIRAEVQKSIKEGRSYYIYKHLLANGAIRDVEIYANPIMLGDGDRELSLSIVHDITDRKKVENALEKTNRELDAFVYTVSHDLSTPLTPIIGYAEILHEKYRDQLDESALEYLAKIISSAENMDILITDLLSLATVGQVERPAEALDVEAVAQTVVSDHAERLSLAGVMVEIGALPSVRVARTLLVQIFDNLIVNALKYGCERGDTIEVGGERNGEKVSLYVRDHGPGIPIDEQGRIFEVFCRGVAGKDKQGTGIGLATVQKIASLFDGRAWVEDTPGGGSTFCVDIVDVPD